MYVSKYLTLDTFRKKMHTTYENLINIYYTLTDVNNFVELSSTDKELIKEYFSKLYEIKTEFLNIVERIDTLLTKYQTKNDDKKRFI